MHGTTLATLDRPLNFLHLTTFYPPHSFGGDAMYIYRLAHALGDAGHHVDVAHCVDAYHLLHPGEPEIQFAGHPNVIVHRLRSGYGWLSPLLTQQTGRPLLKDRRIREILRSRPYDVVHYHNISLLGPHVLKMKPAGDRAVKMYTAHEHWLVCPMHVLWKFNSRPCERPECLKCTLLARRPPQWWRYTGQLRRMGRHVDEFVAPSEFCAHMHQERGFPYPVRSLPYFIDRVDQDWQRPGPRPIEKPYFLFVGRLEQIKGLQTIIAAWKHVREADLLVVGTGTYDAELRAQAAGDPRIRFLGAQPQQALGPLYYHAEACIVPSITFETFGIIIIEAFARKAPVIARDLGALPEVVRESGGGFVYRTDGELLDAIDRIRASAALRAELGERGYRTFVQRWSREAHLEIYFDRLRQAAARRFGEAPWPSRLSSAAGGPFVDDRPMASSG